MDMPAGRSPDGQLFVQALGQRLGFQLSEATFPAENGPPDDEWEVYGRGVSVFVGTAMKDGPPDKFGNRAHSFNRNRLTIHVAKTGLWQNVAFDEVLATSKATARQLGWSFRKPSAGESCAT